MHWSIRNSRSRFKKKTIITFLTKCGPAPCDKKCCSTPDPLLHFRDGLGKNKYRVTWLLLLLTPCRCIFTLEPLIPAAEHMQLATTQHIEHLYPCHMTLGLNPLPRLNNMLPVVLQLNVRCRSHSSSHSSLHHVSSSLGLSVSSGLERIAGEVIVLLLILSGDIETNPGPVGEFLIYIASS